MAEIPTPRSYPQVLGEQIDAFLARLGLPNMREGDPSLSILEAGSQSDVRNSQDIFNLLNSFNLDRAKGLALDRIGASEDVPRLGETVATGTVNIGDSSFSKIQTRVFQGTVAPIVGATVINVEDGLSFPATGSIYIGRGTTDYEGPLAYTSVVNAGNYWVITLNGGNPTQRYHNLGESVILAQGGDRAIPAGALVKTPQGNVGTAVQFRTSFAATIPDGEVLIQNVPVVAQKAGVTGNVPAGAISAFVTPPFSGATVTNVTTFSNAHATETDDEYRERIRNVRNSRSLGTSLAIRTGVTGITAIDENRRVISSSIVTRQNYPTTLYIDDGTGYEETSEGIAYETIADSAGGGESFFSLANGRPVTKAFVATTLSAPFALSDGMRLSVKIGGVRSEHDFRSSDFRSIGNASAYEVASSINGHPGLLFSARTLESGTKVAVFAKEDSNEDVEVVAPDLVFADANPVLGFPAGRSYTLNLYKNDRLLTKDGSLASVTSKPQSLWSAVVDGDILLIEVDGISLPTSLTTFNDIDFVNAGTAYSTVSATNSLASWVQVFNYKLPGITATVDGGAITLTSNSGRSSRARVAVTGGSLGTAMFEAASSQGSTRDYTLDRNLGQIRLETELASGDRLSAGSFSTRGFLESLAFTALNIAADVTNDPGSPNAGAELWVVVDGGAELQATGIGAGTTITIDSVQVGNTQPWGRRVRISHASQGIWNQATIGDWVVLQDPALSVSNRGAFRVAEVDSSPTKLWIEVERPAGGFVTETVDLTRGHVKLVRTDVEPQRVLLSAAANYTPTTVCDAFNTQLIGATASPYRTTKFRLRTNSFGIGGDIAVVSSNAQGLLLGLPVSSAVVNLTPHLASVPAGHPEAGTPEFQMADVTTVTSKTVADVFALNGITPGNVVVGLRAVPDSGPLNRYSNKNHSSALEVITGTTLTFRRGAIQHWLPEDRLYGASAYGITARDQLGFVIDGDDDTKRYVFNAYRKVKPGNSTYGLSNDFKDADNANLSLAKSFGLSFDWTDFAVHMKARVKSHGSPDTTKTGLWRYYRHGAEGNQARVQYQYPLAAGAAVTVETDALSSAYTDIAIRLPAGSARSGYQLRNSSRLGMAVTAGPVGGLYDYMYVLNLPAATANRVIRLDYVNRNAVPYAAVVTGSTSGATAVVVSDSNGPGVAATGYIVITGIVGTFLNGETLTDGGASATESGVPYGYTTLTLTLPAPITNHGLAVSDVVWLQSTDINFSTGAKTIVDVTATDISYRDAATAAAGVAIGTVSSDNAGEVTLSGSTVVAGDIFHVGSGTSFADPFVRTVKLQSIAAGDYMTAQSDVVGAVSTTLSWAAVNDDANLSWYPIGGSNTIANIVSAVNALTNCSITGVAVGSGGVSTGTISDASYEASELGGTDPWYYLTDGLNWIRSQVDPISVLFDYNMTFKAAVSAPLASNSDWANEDVRLVPITALNVANYLNSSGVSGLFGATEVAAAVKGGRPQVTSITPGSTASVRSDGGAANVLVASIEGGAVSVAGTAVASISTGNSQGLNGLSWVSLQNGQSAPKTCIDSGTILTLIQSDGSIQLNGAGSKAWTWATTAPGAIDNLGWQIERQGDFLAFVHVIGAAPALAGVTEGDWVIVEAATTPPAGTTAVDSLNRGQFRVVRIDTTNNVFWVENPSGVEEIGACKLRFLTYNSAMPGDTLLINSSLWGVDNVGSWSISAIDDTDQWLFYVDVTDRAPALQGAVAALGGSADLIKVYEGQPSRLIKRITAISPNADPLLTDIKFNTDASYYTINESYGTVLRALDKLAFGIDTRTGTEQTLATGVDGYKHSIGLIAETNRVVYGDESDRSSYPGIAAAGARINTSGPLVKRISMSLVLRVQTGVSRQDIENKVKSGIADAVNKSPVGVSLSISNLVSIAQAVNGVISVTVLSPSFGPGNDRILVQPFEKPKVLNINDDIQVSYVGD